MNNDFAIRVENLSKRYRIGQDGEGMYKYKSLRDSIANAISAPFKRLGWTSRRSDAERPDDHIWALKDVSFEVNHGEVIGVIGRNGAGKTTLLKVLSRITEPTEGCAALRGRVGSLLEVGTGFHPELTGRENVYLSGAILGMRKAEIIRKFDEIVAFAEVEKFIDTPVKRYSSGMCVRLGFAVAAHLDPEILLVDEVLAVGDIEFQKKCLGKMEDVAGEGRTVLFVSHNMVAVQNLCPKALLLDEGKTVCFDRTSTVVEKYLAVENDLGGEVRWESPDNAPGNRRLRLQAVRVVSEGQVTGSPPVDEDIEIQVDYRNLEQNGRRLISVHVLNSMGYTLFTSSNLKSVSAKPDVWVDREYPIGLFRTTCVIPRFLMNPGQHTIHVCVYINGRMDNILFEKNIISFKVRETERFRTEFFGEWIGAVRPLLHWETAQLE